MKSRMLEDDVIFARLSEEADYRWNQSKSDRFVVVGLKSTEYPPGLAERKEFLAKLLHPLVESIVGEVVFDIYPRNANMQNGKIPPFVLRFPSTKDCESFKKDAYKTSLSFETLKGTGYQPCVTPSSRVRVEVLRALSRKLSAGDLFGYCPIYGMRPLLHLGPRVDGRVQAKETLTYVPAIQRYGNLLTLNDLIFAYRSVGDGFKGCLRQNFIVLNEEGRASLIEEAKKANNQQGRGTKRPNPNESQSKSKK